MAEPYGGLSDAESPPGTPTPNTSTFDSIHTLSSDEESSHSLSTDPDLELPGRPRKRRRLRSAPETGASSAHAPDQGGQSYGQQGLKGLVQVNVHAGASVRDVQVNVYNAPHATHGGTVNIATADGSQRQAILPAGATSRTVDVLPGYRDDMSSLPLPSEGGPSPKRLPNAFTMLARGAMRQKDRGYTKGSGFKVRVVSCSCPLCERACARTDQPLCSIV
jgi:prepilin-type processing-associated H-X9-DG protein